MTRPKPKTKKPKAVHVMTPEGTELTISLLHQREGNWSAGYQFEFEDGMRAEGAVSGNYPTRENAIIGVCHVILARLHQAVDTIHDAAGKTKMRNVLSFVRKFRMRYDEKIKRPDVPKSIAEEIHRTVCPKGIAEQVSRKGAKPQRPEAAHHGKAAEAAGTALVPHVSAIADVLSGDETKALKRCEAEIERSGQKALEAVLARGRALTEIRDSRLYRRTHSTFESYAAEKWQLRKTSAYELIDAARAHDLAQPAAEKLGLKFTALAQFRPLAKLETKADMQAVMKRAAKEIEHEGTSQRGITMEVLSRAVKEETTSPDDLKQERETAKDRKVESARLKESTAQTPRAAAADVPREPYFPAVETIGQARVYIRSWIGAMMRQFGVEQIDELDEELYQGCLTLRNFYKPKMAGKAK